MTNTETSEKHSDMVEVLHMVTVVPKEEKDGATTKT